MILRNVFFLLLLSLISCSEISDNFKRPTIIIAILVRNKAHTLPYFLTFLEQLDYPKDRITLWIRSDNNIDNSIEILRAWLRVVEEEYHHVDTYFDKKSSGFSDESSHSHWSPKRFSHIMNLREEALDYARNHWADYVFILDADAFLTNPQTLNQMISHDFTIAAPLLRSDGLYSNFWAGMTTDYYYLRTEKYTPILNGEEIGCFEVPMIHSAVLINLKKKSSDLLTYQSKNVPDYSGPEDDIIAFAIMANQNDIPLNVCNDNKYGFIMVPLERDDSIDADKQQLMNIKIEMLNHMVEIPILPRLEKFIEPPQKTTLGLSHIFMINLVRRPERRTRMLRCFDELGLEVETIDAIDGRNLDYELLDKMGIKFLPNYLDPIHKRPMKMGEVGCFLSHYAAWNKVVESGYDYAMVLEDDVKFEPYFNQKVAYALIELKNLGIPWDIIYLGRKRLQEEKENWVEGSKYVVYAGYSYWTIGYLLSYRGAEKLIQAKPLQNLLPVDEYLPVLFDKHPRTDWKEHYPRRNLIALSMAPLVIYPTHYTGEKGYISDTELSEIITDDKPENEPSRDEF